MRPQLTEQSECKLYGRIDPAEGWKNIEEIFPTSSLRRDCLNITN